PGGLSINSSTGAITGTVAVGAAADGPYTVTVLAEDGTYFGETSFHWAVNCPVSLTTPDDQSNTEGDAVSLAISASGSGTLSYSASGLPTSLSINSSTGVISGTISSGLTAGVYTTTVTVTDGTNTAKLDFAWTIFAAGTIVVTNPGAQ